MSDILLTVKIKTETERGFAIINQTDFKADEHELYEEKAKAKAKTTKAKTAKAAVN
jgi:hypothetical protein